MPIVIYSDTIARRNVKSFPTGKNIDKVNFISHLDLIK